LLKYKAFDKKSKIFCALKIIDRPNDEEEIDENKWILNEEKNYENL